LEARRARAAVRDDKAIFRRTDCGAVVVVVVVVAVEEEEEKVVVVMEVVVLIWSAQNDHKIIPAHH